MTEPDDRTAVQTYVPASQRELWRREASEMDMSQAEFVRSMVQAGRRSFGLNGDDGETGSADANPRGQPLETRVRDIVASEHPLDWDELVAELTDDVEERLDAALETLQEENVVQYSGRDGGYVPTDVE